MKNGIGNHEIVLVPGCHFLTAWLWANRLSDWASIFVFLQGGQRHWSYLSLTISVPKSVINHYANIRWYCLITVSLVDNSFPFTQVFLSVRIFLMHMPSWPLKFFCQQNNYLYTFMLNWGNLYGWFCHFLKYIMVYFSM